MSKYIVELWKCEAYEFDRPDEDGYSISLEDAIEHAFNLADDDADSFMNPVDRVIVREEQEDGSCIIIKEM